MSFKFWPSVFVLFSFILKEFDVCCMMHDEKGESSQTLPDKSKDSSSSGGVVDHSNQHQILTNNGKRILLITEYYEPHYNFAYINSSEHGVEGT
uniref:Uncharacterized protein n=1 Tax=Meloidogyne hapla TaxID=6305 RepID=A0A1I8BME3_MELHA